MQIFLSVYCTSLSGSFGRGFGYYIRRVPSRNGSVRFFTQRSKHYVPADGHWRFILACAELAKNGLHVADINVHWQELADALYEAHHFTAACRVGLNGREAKKITYNANDIINLKHTFDL